MAYPGATLIEITKYGLNPIRLAETQHFRLLREFCIDPANFIESVLEA
jgi:predicted ATPase